MYLPPIAPIGPIAIRDYGKEEKVSQSPPIKVERGRTPSSVAQ